MREDGTADRPTIIMMADVVLNDVRGSRAAFDLVFADWQLSYSNCFSHNDEDARAAAQESTT